MIYPILTEQPFVSPKDNKGTPLFYQISAQGLRKLPKGSTVYLVDRIPLDAQKNDLIYQIIQEHDLVLQRMEKVPMEAYRRMCVPDKIKYKNYV